MAKKQRNTMEINCPDCGAVISVDTKTGEVLMHRKGPRKPADGKDLDSLMRGLEENRSKADALFEKQQAAIADRDRLMEEKFQAALKHAEKTKDEDLPLRPFDLD